MSKKDEKSEFIGVDNLEDGNVDGLAFTLKDDE